MMAGIHTHPKPIVFSCPVERTTGAYGCAVGIAGKGNARSQILRADTGHAVTRTPSKAVTDFGQWIKEHPPEERTIR